MMDIDTAALGRVLGGQLTLIAAIQQIAARAARHAATRPIAAELDSALITAFPDLPPRAAPQLLEEAA